METKELTHALISHAERISRDCLPFGRKIGNFWKAGSVHGEKGESLVVTLNKGKWTDYNSDEDYGDMLGLIFATIAKRDWPEAFKIAEDYVGNVDYQNSRVLKNRPEKKVKSKHNKNKRFAYKIWNDANLEIGEAGQLYLKSRKLYVTEYYSKYIIRYVANLKHMDGQNYPALIFRITDVDNKFLGIQRIYLTVDGKKIEEDAKLTLGDVMGGSLKMGRYKPKTILLSEGVEDGLSLNPMAFKNKDLGIWSGLGAKQLMTIDVPNHVERIIICSDNDEITEAVIEKLQSRYGDEKLVIAHLPPKEFKDYNEFLVKKNGFQIEHHFQKLIGQPASELLVK